MSEIWPAYLRLLCNAVAAGMLLSLLTLDVAHANQTESANSGASEGAAKKDAFETCLTSLAFQTNIPYRTDAKFKESKTKSNQLLKKLLLILLLSNQLAERFYPFNLNSIHHCFSFANSQRW